MANAEKIRDILVKVYSSVHEDADPQHKRDFAFHMTDWSSDLEQLAKLYASPDKFSEEEAEAIVTAFL